MDTTPTSPLARFRRQLYQDVLGLRRDALCELLDAVLSGDRATSLVRHSLTPGCQRGWASLGDALSDGRIDVVALRRLFVQTLPQPRAGERPLWVIDGTLWPRPAAKSSAERTLGRFVTGGTPHSGIMAGWEYQWLVAITEASGSWGLPLEVRRRAPQAGTATTVALSQLHAVLAMGAPTTARPVLLLDSHYDVAALVQAELGLDILARLRSNRRFYRPPGPYPGQGAPRKHGPVFRCADPATHGPPDQTQGYDDPTHGRVTIDLWERLHSQPAPAVELTVLRVTVARLPRRDTPPAPLWLVWQGGRGPARCAPCCAGISGASPSSIGSASSSTSWGGPPSAPAPRRAPTAGVGSWPPPCGSCGWRGRRSPPGACPGSAPSSP
jgi:DDE superfamily endonuclease